MASVKHAAPFVPGERTVRNDPQQVSYRYVSMSMLLMQAWEVKAYQIDGPKWLDEEHYDIVAKLPQGADPKLVPEMLRTLLEQRFGIQVHKETRVVRAYALVADKDGPKLRASQAVEIPRDAEETVREAAYREAQRKGQIVNGVALEPGRLVFGSQTLAIVARCLSGILDRPVIDMTGIPGEFDFELQVAPDEVGGPGAMFLKQIGNPDDAPGSIFTSLRKYGLKLDQRNLPIEYLVLDQAEKTPTEN